ncbi:hypothetical protein PG994_009511 [Apiospora phragmitis]|uniref:Uncharacterized protein n=1 Tax=Apiospora phragmitis TaxID=2905665 RepID=A0ABR1U6C2_9PEZI
MSYDPYYWSQNRWGANRFADRPSAYIRPGVVDWRSPGAGYPGYNPNDIRWRTAWADYNRQQKYQRDSAARLRPNNITAWAEQMRGWR